MFGCYRRSEAADADTYTGAVAMVLAHYSAEVVTAVTDPFNGLPARKKENGYSGLPDVADVKEACEAEDARLVRMAHYARLTVQKRLPAPPQPHVPTIFTPKDFPHWDKLMRRYEAGDRPAHFETRECVDKVERYGIWTPFSWIDDDPKGSRLFKPHTDAELRAMYPPREAPAETVGEGAE